MRRHPVGQVEIYFVDIAPAPAFRRIIAFDDRVARRMIMLCRVAIGGIVATADMAAGPAEPEVDPPAASLETFLATIGARRHGVDIALVRTAVAHHFVPVLARHHCAGAGPGAMHS